MNAAELQEKRNREQNDERGSAVNRLKGSNDWQLILEIKRDLMNDLYKGLFVQATNLPLCLEPTYAQIISNRQGVIDGVEQFFSLLDKLEGVYLRHKQETK